MGQSTAKSGFNAGWSSVAFIVSAATFSIAILNLFIDLFDLPIAPFAEPLITLYGYLDAALDWLNVRVDWMVPDWHSAVTILSILVLQTAVRGYNVLHDMTSETKYDYGVLLVSSVALNLITLVIILACLAIPVVRWIVPGSATIWILILIVVNLSPGRDDDSADFQVRYFLGHAVAAIILLGANYYYS